MKKLILGCLLALFASGCNDNEPEQKPVELKISFAGENPVEFTVGEQKRLAFTVTGDDLEGLTFAAEPDEALSGWTVVVSAGREGDAYAGALDVTASATPSETAVTLTVTDRNGKPWSATTPTLTAVQAPVTAIDLSRDGTANCYIVSEAGDYMFDAAVRGNGSGDDAAIALADGMKADWLWVTKGLEQEISAVSLDAGKGRIFFTAAGAAKGNAVIALADAAGEIVWSWHLWFTPEPRMVTYANGRVLLDRSLGDARIGRGLRTLLPVGPQGPVLRGYGPRNLGDCFCAGGGKFGRQSGLRRYACVEAGERGGRFDTGIRRGASAFVPF